MPYKQCYSLHGTYLHILWWQRYRWMFDDTSCTYYIEYIPTIADLQQTCNLASFNILFKISVSKGLDKGVDLGIDAPTETKLAIVSHGDFLGTVKTETAAFSFCFTLRVRRLSWAGHLRVNLRFATNSQFAFLTTCICCSLANHAGLQNH